VTAVIPSVVSRLPVSLYAPFNDLVLFHVAPLYTSKSPVANPLTLTSESDANAVATGDVPLDAIPPTERNNPPGMIVAYDEFNKSLAGVVPPCTIIYPRKIALSAVLGASVNGSLSFALTALSKLEYCALP